MFPIYMAYIRARCLKFNHGNYLDQNPLMMSLRCRNTQSPWWLAVCFKKKKKERKIVRKQFLDYLIHFYGLPKNSLTNYRAVLVFVTALSCILIFLDTENFMACPQINRQNEPFVFIYVYNLQFLLSSEVVKYVIYVSHTNSAVQCIRVSRYAAKLHVAILAQCAIHHSNRQPWGFCFCFVFPVFLLTEWETARAVNYQQIGLETP